MTIKKDTAKPKVKKSPSAKSKPVSRNNVRPRPVEPKPIIVEPQPQVKTQVIDEKSLRTISQLTGFLSVGVVFTAFTLVIQIWATLKAGFVFTPVSFLYVVVSLALIASLIWCIRLINQKRASSIWVFLGFIVAHILYTLAFRWFDGKAVVVPMDLVTWIVLAAILFELYRLQRKHVLS